MDMLTCDCLQAATLLAADSLRRINPSLADLVLRRSQDINIPVVGDETNAYFPSVNLQIVADKQANAVRRASVYLLYAALLTVKQAATPRVSQSTLRSSTAIQEEHPNRAWCV